MRIVCSSDMQAMFQIVSDPIPKLTNLTSFSPPFLNFIDVCLNKDPTQRATIKQLLAVRALALCALVDHDAAPLD